MEMKEWINGELAQTIWENFVDTLGNHNLATEWLVGMSKCLFSEENEVQENSFLSQVRKKAETQAINRKNIKVVK